MMMMNNDDNDKYSKVKKQRKKVTHTTTKVMLLITIVFLCFVLFQNTRNNNSNRSTKVYNSRDALRQRLRREIMGEENIFSKGNFLDNSKSNVLQHRLKLQLQAKQKALEQQAMEEIERIEQVDEEDEQEQEQLTVSALERMSMDDLTILYNKYDEKIRKRRKQVDIFETDIIGQKLKIILQNIARQLLYQRYGSDIQNGSYQLELQLQFEETMPDYQQKGSTGSILIELAPSTLIPVSIYTILEIARHWNGGAFNRVAEHVIQANVWPPKKGISDIKEFKAMPFQEYSNDYPHLERTCGFAGRPSGPQWYINIKDNSKVHGPGTQQKKDPYEADSLFGTVIQGYEDIVQGRLTKIPCIGFCNDATKSVKIIKINILNTIYDPNEIQEMEEEQQPEKNGRGDAALTDPSNEENEGEQKEQEEEKVLEEINEVVKGGEAQQEENEIDNDDPLSDIGNDNEQQEQQAQQQEEQQQQQQEQQQHEAQQQQQEQQQQQQQEEQQQQQQEQQQDAEEDAEEEEEDNDENIVEEQ